MCVCVWVPVCMPVGSVRACAGSCGCVRVGASTVVPLCVPVSAPALCCWLSLPLWCLCARLIFRNHSRYRLPGSHPRHCLPHRPLNHCQRAVLHGEEEKGMGCVLRWEMWGWCGGGVGVMWGWCGGVECVGVGGGGWGVGGGGWGVGGGRWAVGAAGRAPCFLQSCPDA